MESSHPNRRWYQFSLRALFALMLLVSGYFAGWATAIRQARQAELQAIQAAEVARMAQMEAHRQAERAQMLAEFQQNQLEKAQAALENFEGSDSDDSAP